jgi:hypothetical protein
MLTGPMARDILLTEFRRFDAQVAYACRFHVLELDGKLGSMRAARAACLAKSVHFRTQHFEIVLQVFQLLAQEPGFFR